MADATAAMLDYNTKEYIVMLPGNQTCADCTAIAPDWASSTYGVLLCLECSGIHRRLGVHISFVRSVHMDEWKREEVQMMLQGGNRGLATYLAEHGEGAKNPTGVMNAGYIDAKYKSTAAAGYARQLQKQVRTGK